MSDLCKDETCPGRFREVIKDETYIQDGKTFTVPRVPRSACVVCDTEMFGSDACNRISTELREQGYRFNDRFMTDYQPAYTVEEFQALPKAKQRQAIARDVILQLELQRMSAAGCYLIARGVPAEQAQRDQDVRTILQSVEKCQVCALGAVFVSAVCLGDQLQTGWADFTAVYTPHDYRPEPCVMRTHLGHIFEFEQQQLIERCYAGWVYPDDEGEYHAAFLFRGDFDFREEIMKGIMTMIAEHPEGLFVPSEYRFKDTKRKLHYVP